MEKLIKEIIVNGVKMWQVTTPDSRWYGREVKNQETGLPEIEWLPSDTWIMSYYYKSPYLIKWMQEKGVDEAETIKKEAGTKGDRIHKGCEVINTGKEVAMTDQFLNKETKQMEELSVEEYEAIISYKNCVDEMKPQILAYEMAVFSKLSGGTLDGIWAIPTSEVTRQIYIIDIKSSKSIYKSMIGQISSYSHKDIDYKLLGITDEEWENRKLAILQVGYNRNKNGWKWTEVDDKYNLFEIAYATWKEENPTAKPRQIELPMKIKSAWIASQTEPKIAELAPIKKVVAKRIKTIAKAKK